MLQILPILFLCWVKVQGLDVKHYDTMLRQLMDEDEHERIRRLAEETYSSGDDSNPGGDLTPESLSPVIIMAIVVTSIIALGTLFFLGSCAWYKLKTVHPNQPFARVTTDDGDESALYMVDYDELDLQHAQLAIGTQDTRSETPIHNSSKA